ncbi:SH3 domain-binding glutamic acid-rich-like protein isoform 3 [Schistosoma japonicum]|uniref:SH3 domain-binding glutamic acid-rich-like protein isoform 3 n=1 Tax=Schistosoma japonicum TaxID=6182 RepID=A0A4Z2D422_SCHJA|nr:SH3 domain-binding glutamic acid-rich-like protein isoform 3 [Schistosoma japonicum]
MVVEVYISSTSGNTNVKSRQQYIMNVLSAAKIPFEVKDISSSETYKQFMQKVLKDNGKTPIAPQLFFGSEYLGVYLRILLIHLLWFIKTILGLSRFILEIS